MSRASMMVSALVSSCVFTCATSASADAVPTGMRGVRYSFSIENLRAYPDHVFILYPTTNSGYGYVVEPGVGLTHVMMSAGRIGGETRLHVMRRSDYTRFARTAERHPHGDNDEMVWVVDEPPGPPRSLVAAAHIARPGLVPESSRVGAIERVFRIARLTSSVFELELVREIMVPYDGGGPVTLIDPTIPPTTPQLPTPPSPPPTRAAPTTPVAPATPAAPATRAAPSARAPAPSAGSSSGCAVRDATKHGGTEAGCFFAAIAIVASTRARRRRR